MEEARGKIKESEQGKLVENADYYFESGLMVLTERFLKRRGYCCKNGCRRCPYQEKKEDAL